MAKQQKIYDKRLTQPQEVVIDYLKDHNFEIGYCKYSDELIAKHHSGRWMKHHNKILNNYVLFNHYNINIKYNKEVKGGTSGSFQTVVRGGVKIQDNTGFKVIKSSWESLLSLVGNDNMIDTTLNAYTNIFFDYDKDDLKKLTETNRFIERFSGLCKGDNKFNQEKARVMLNTQVRRSLGLKTDYVAVFKSLEGSGKSEFLADELLGFYNDNHLLNPNAKLSDKDWEFKEYFGDNCAMIIEEQGVGSKAHEAFKNFTTMTDFQLKPKGSNVVQNKLSRAMMYFTTNQKEFIYGDDETNRRFLIFDLEDRKLWNEEDDNSYSSIFKDIDFNKLWAEQYSCFMLGINYKVDWKKLGIENKAYVVKTSFRNKDNYILDILVNEIIDQTDGVEHWITGVDVQVIIHEIYGDSIQVNHNDNNEICKTLKKLGLDYKKRKCDINLPCIEIGFDKFYENKFVNRNKVKINKTILSSLGLPQPVETSLGLPMFDWNKDQKK